MTQVLDRPKTEVDTGASTEVLPRPIEVEKEEIRQLPPESRRPRVIRWLAWLVGIAAVVALAWLVIAEITADDAPTATPTTIGSDVDAITADPKARTPVVTAAMVADAVRTGEPGVVSLTEVVTFGHDTAPINFEDATVNPMIYWAVTPTHASMMEEATVSPLIYEAQAVNPYDHWVALYDAWVARYNEALSPATPGNYWLTHDLVPDERAMFEGFDLAYGIWPAYYADPATVVAAPEGHFGGQANLMR